MPGTDIDEAIALVFGELPDLPYLPELPARGPGSDMIGRTAALLVDLPVETTVRGWKLGTRPGQEQRSAASQLGADLDALEVGGADFAGLVKISICGPWTLAASLELNRSIEPALSDDGAVRDLVASLSEAVAAHAANVQGRLPRSRLLVQLDEPSLPGVLAGSIPSSSGLYRVSPVDGFVASQALGQVIAAPGVPVVVHCCARDVPFDRVRAAGAAAISCDFGLIPDTANDAIGEAAEAGLGIFAGLGNAEPSKVALTVIERWRRIGLPDDRLTEQVVFTPACGLAGATPAGAKAALVRCREAARLAPELVEEGVRERT